MPSAPVGDPVSPRGHRSIHMCNIESYGYTAALALRHDTREQDPLQSNPGRSNAVESGR